ncbi:LysR family transcriptional regulator [Pseudogracilibacillus auburnensis]|uniref:DNA-binding transcriptional LysR family regulator n=1 Tax=Pseudogracilibacillus auburnensis TaxID=1494959 RepID=A0A2V3VPI3_9BACI|nr:LysR family transcriptional regulator [Pseudogracilibacillus auburnensis]PXW83752.1 DNA-binding transcriptional LysR family regulator [Pseudogracilibacillus auburnensis]
MNLKQLRYFYEIANEGQITRAAKKLHIAQPPLSQSLKALEDRLGVILFERNGRRMELTDAGAVLYEKAKELFYKIDETMIEVKETGKGVRGTLSIGCNKSCFSRIPKTIRTYQEKYPQVKFKLLEGDSYFLTKQLVDREIEVAIIRLPIDMNGFSYLRLPEEEYVVVIPNNWINEPDKKMISIEELVEIPLLLLHRIRGVGQFELIMDKFRDKGLTPNIICESPNVDMLLGLVTEGLGATVVPKSTLLKHNTSNVSVLHIEDTHIVSESAIIWLKDRYLSKSAERFIELFN